MLYNLHRWERVVKCAECISSRLKARFNLAKGKGIFPKCMVETETSFIVDIASEVLEQYSFAGLYE
jgi:hypothetical protein